MSLAFPLVIPVGRGTSRRVSGLMLVSRERRTMVQQESKPFAKHWLVGATDEQVGLGWMGSGPTSYGTSTMLRGDRTKQFQNRLILPGRSVAFMPRTVDLCIRIASASASISTFTCSCLCGQQGVSSQSCVSVISWRRNTWPKRTSFSKGLSHGDPISNTHGQMMCVGCGAKH